MPSSGKVPGRAKHRCLVLWLVRGFSDPEVGILHETFGLLVSFYELGVRSRRRLAGVPCEFGAVE